MSEKVITHSELETVVFLYDRNSQLAKNGRRRFIFCSEATITINIQQTFIHTIRVRHSKY